MKNLTALDWVALVLVLVGGLNWGLVGLFQYDLVSALFASMPVVAKIVYVLVGLAALYLIVISGKLAKK
ncbi:MAG: DUF378 domain-containing protein [Candidatus Peribacteraceae bacterium]|jgi:hypothetical protein